MFGVPCMPVDIDLISKHIASLRLKTGLDALYPRSMEITQLPSRTNPLPASGTEDVNPTRGAFKKAPTAAESTSVFSLKLSKMKLLLLIACVAAAVTAKSVNKRGAPKDFPRNP